jgi:hypothetical protein
LAKRLRLELNVDTLASARLFDELVHRFFKQNILEEFFLVFQVPVQLD